MQKAITLHGTLLFCAWLVLFCCAQSSAQRMKEGYETVSVRWTAQTPLTQENLVAASEAAQALGLGVSFWGQRTATVKTDLAQTNALAVTTAGDADACFSARYITGAAPGPGDKGGCAISRALAWQMFGSMDIVGQTLHVDGVQFRVTGVFDDGVFSAQTAADTQVQDAMDAPVILCSAELQNIKMPEQQAMTQETAKALPPQVLPLSQKDAKFYALELIGTSRSDRSADVKRFLQQSKLPPPAAVVYGPSVAMLARALAWLTALPLTLRIWRRLRLRIALCMRAKRPQKEPAAFLYHTLVCAVPMTAFVLLLVLAIYNAPAWVLPARVSSFSAWQEVGASVLQKTRAYMQLAPMMKDMQARMYLLQIVLCAAFALGLGSAGETVNAKRAAHTES